MRERCWRDLVIASFTCLVLVGCGVHEFRSETTLHSDGSVERAIYQPQNETPEPARSRELWQQTTWAGEILGDKWTGSIRDLPIRTEPERSANGTEKTPVYFAAWGKFDTVAKLPEHFSRDVDVGEKRTVKLTRNYERIDYGFVVEHRWSERLNDIVRLDDMRRARRELFDLLTEFSLEVLSQRLKENYDLSRLKTWLRDEGFPWFEDLIDLWYEWAAEHGTHRGNLPQHERDAQRRLVELCARRGLKLPEPSETLFKDPHAGDTVRKFAADKLPELIRQRDGEPLDKAKTLEILIWLGLADRPKDRDAEKESPLEVLSNRVTEERYGGDQAFKERTGKLARRIHGAFGWTWIPEQFHVSMTMPGLIVETSGELVAVNKTVWEFESGEVFPWGYEMICRSLDIDEKRLKAVLKSNPLETLTARRDFVRELAADAKLADAIRLSARDGTLKPLDAHAASEELDAAGRLRLQRIRRLLRLDSPRGVRCPFAAVTCQL